MKTNFRQMVCFLLCFVVSVGLIPAAAFADQPVILTEDVIPSTSQELDTTDLEDQYINQLFYGKSPSLFALHDKDEVMTLTPGEQEFFDILVAHIEKIAAEGGSTSLEVTAPTLMQEISAPSMDELRALIANCCQHVDHMLKSCYPELLYWCGYGGAYSWRASMYGPTKENENYKLAGITISYRVASNYRATPDDDKTVDSARIQRAIQAKENAQQIAQEISASGKAPLEQLRDMKNTICQLTDYNFDALDQGTMQKNDLGDPWQLVGVFDNDPATKVVCEGYSKAFQYLCDLTFPADGPECFLVTGLLRAGGSSGGHMWNLVRMDNETYLVDVTNCDIPDAPASDSLFMVNPANAHIVSQKYAEHYIVHEEIPGYVPREIEFIYDDSTKALYTTDVLALSDKTTHNWSDWKVINEATCMTPGKKTRICSHCNWVQEQEIPALGHDFVYQSDETNHWQVCSRCDTVSTLEPHTFGDWNTRTEATETTEGLEERICSVCGHKETRTIPVVIHPEEKFGWIEVDCGWKYRNKDGSYVIDDWLQLDGIWYYCDADGYMLTGWQNLSTGRFYFDQWGHMSESRWEMIDGKFYYFNEWGHCAVNRWEQVDGLWYWFDASGQMVIDWNYIDGNWYYFDAHGTMLKDWQYIETGWFYFDENGHMLTGWQWINGSWFYMNAWGQMATDWQYIDNTWYYFNESGQMLTDWQWIGGNCYYFYANGAMATDAWINGSYVNSSGIWVA